MKKIIAIVAAGIVVLGMALGVVSFSGSSKVSFSTTYTETNKAGETVTTTNHTETGISTDKGITSRSTETTTVTNGSKTTETTKVTDGGKTTETTKVTETVKAPNAANHN